MEIEIGNLLLFALLMIFCGFGLGMILYPKWIGIKDMTTDDALNVLRSKGYWVNLNCRPGGKE